MALISPALHHIHVHGGALTLRLRDNDLADETRADLRVCFEEHVVL